MSIAEAKKIEGIEEVAVNLIKENQRNELIARVTGFSIETINGLRDKVQGKESLQ